MKRRTTIGSYFTELRESKGLTLIQVGIPCFLAESTIHKIGADKPVRWETVHLALTVGLKIVQGSEAYETCHRLWMKQRAELAEHYTPEHGKNDLSPHAKAAVKEFRALVRNLDIPALGRVMTSVRSAVTRNSK